MPDAPTIGIYISYGRLDADAVTRAIAERLEAEFGGARIYMDAGAVQKGEDWTEALNRRLLRSSLMLVLIHPGWLQARMIAARDSLDDDGDFARLEIEAALKLGLRVIPVLLNGATFHRLEGLPLYLRPLARRQSLTLADGRFDRDIEYLVYALRQALAELKSPLPEGTYHVLASGLGGGPSIALHWHPALTTSLTHTRRRVAQVLHPLGGEVLPAVTAWRAAFWLLLAALLLWGVVWPYLWPALMPAPTAVAAAEAPLPAATGPVLPVGTRFRDCRDVTCPWLRVLPAGTFMMGSPDDEPGRDKDEGPQHQVTVAKPFAVMETEVTVGQFSPFVRETGYQVSAGCGVGFEQTNEDPVVCVSWHDARAYARWMTRRTKQPYRLLSEAEWEYAARAGTTTPFAFGDRIDTSQANFDGNFTYKRSTQGEYRQKTLPVGSLAKNAWGLYDMHGNVWEWVQDCSNTYTAAARTADAIERMNCGSRLLRGGGWIYNPGDTRSANRNGDAPGDRNDVTGFRLARMLP